MRRDTEFRWQPRSSSRSKFAVSLLIAVAAIATGSMFVNAGRQQVADNATSEAAISRVRPPARAAIEEPSGVATAAPLRVQLLNPSNVSRLAELESDEPSAVATTAPPAVPNAPFQASIEREEPAPTVTKLRVSSGYATLRQAYLRNIR